MPSNTGNEEYARLAVSLLKGIFEISTSNSFTTWQHKGKCFIHDILPFTNTIDSAKLLYLQLPIFETSYRPCFLSQSGDCTKLEDAARRDLTEWVQAFAHQSDQLANAGLVDLTSDDFFGTGVDYLGFTLWDSPICSILPFLGAASDFIDRALKAEGKVMVCCQMGVSRSAACVLAYLMINREMDAASALGLLRRRRDCRPNDGFLEQLVALDTDLQLVRQLGREPSISLAFVDDLPSLPRPWNYEFYTKEVTEEEVGTPLVYLGEPCPLRLSGFSSLASTPLCSKSVSRRESRRSQTSRFPSREPSFLQVS